MLAVISRRVKKHMAIKILLRIEWKLQTRLLNNILVLSICAHHLCLVL